MSEKVIDDDIQELQKELGHHKLTPYQIRKVRYAMADYALAATMDSEIQKEAEVIACRIEEEEKQS